MGRSYILRHLLLAFVLANAIYFLDEGLYSFAYYKQPGEVLLLLILTILIGLAPVTIHSLMKGKQPLLAYIGYLPVLLLLLVMLV